MKTLKTVSSKIKDFASKHKTKLIIGGMTILTVGTGLVCYKRGCIRGDIDATCEIAKYTGINMYKKTGYATNPNIALKEFISVDEVAERLAERVGCTVDDEIRVSILAQKN